MLMKFEQPSTSGVIINTSEILLVVGILENAPAFKEGFRSRFFLKQPNIYKFIDTSETLDAIDSKLLRRT